MLLPFPSPTTTRVRVPVAHIPLTDLGGGASIAHQRRFLDGGARLFEQLKTTVDWKSKQRMMYDRVVSVPRLLGRPAANAPSIVQEIRTQLSARFDVAFDSCSAALYRSGNDSVAWHGDRLGDLRSNSVVAVVSLGGSRRFLTRPTGGGPSTRYDLADGDLILMCGSIHLTHEHCVPKMREAQPRIALMYRHTAPINVSRA